MSLGRNNKRAGFTLTELLVVIGIMGILIYAAGPMFNGLTRSSGMKGATMQLRTTISLARQWAITHRAKTYIVFPTDPTLESDKGTGVTSRIKRSYNVYTTQDGFIKDWTYLPNGVFFDDRQTGDTGNGPQNVITTAQPSPPASVWNTALVSYPPGASKKVPMYCIAFNPDGTTTGMGDIWRQPQVYFAEGYRDNDSATTVKYQTGKMVNILQVGSMTGLIKTFEK